MKAIILCAGVGQRLGIDKPKCLLEFNNIPLIQYQLRKLNNFCSEIIVVTGYEEQKIKEVVDSISHNYCLFNTYVHNPFFRVTNTLASLILAIDKIKNSEKEEILIINGDVLFEPKLINKINNINGDVFAIQKMPEFSLEEVKEKKENNKIKNIGKWVKSNYEAIGVYKLSYDTAMEVYNVAQYMTNFHKNYYEDAFDKVNLEANYINTKAVEIDFPEDLKIAHKFYKEVMK
ncbi:MAG: NTP transferase domain-containing protein [bacterium]